LAWDNISSLGSVLNIQISQTDVDSNDNANLFTPVNSPYQLRIYQTSTPANYQVLQVINPTVDQGAYWDIPAVVIDSGGTGATFFSQDTAVTFEIIWKGADGAAGDSTSVTNYFTDAATSGDPGSGNMGWNNATQLSATTLRFADLNGLTYSDWGTVWQSVKSPYLITLSDASAPANYQIWLVTGTTTDGTGFYTVPVSTVSSGGSGATLSGQLRIDIAYVGATGATGPTGSAGATGPTGSSSGMSLLASESFTGSTTYTPSASAKLLVWEVIGAGGGGGSGRSSTGTGSAFGGGGGSGGGYWRFTTAANEFLVADPDIDITIGAGGAGGTSVNTATTGLAGAGGGDVVIETDAAQGISFRFQGGNQGSGGSTGTGAIGAIGMLIPFFSSSNVLFGSGGNSASTGNAFSGVQNFNGGGGGGGGGGSSVSSNGTGGAGGNSYSGDFSNIITRAAGTFTVNTGGGGAGGAGGGNAGTAGADGITSNNFNNKSTSGLAGQGGGGGGGATSAAGGTGGTGGYPGGGGGGGAGTGNNNNSGAGGAGGNARVRLWVFG
jgi:hypothetical protein